MATFNMFDILVQDLAHGVHDWSGDQLEYALTATASAPVAGNSVLTDLTQITYTDLSARTITLNSSSQTGGTYTLSLTDHTMNCTGVGANAFQYVAVFNQGTTAKVDPLMCWYDYGSALTLNNGESFTVDWGSDGGSTGTLLTIS